jgi:hypothetical protein
VDVADAEHLTSGNTLCHHSWGSMSHIYRCFPAARY